MSDRPRWYRQRFAVVAVAVLLEAALVLSWSGGFVGVRFLNDHAPIFSILLWRSLVSGVLLLPVAIWFGPPMQRRDVLVQMLYGAFAMAAYLGSYSQAIARGVPTGVVALITDMLPLIVAVLSWPVLGQRLSAPQWVGTAIGMLGVLVASAATLKFADVSLGWYLLPVLGTAALALGSLLQQGRAASAMPVYQQLCIQCLSAALVFAPFAWYEGGLLPVMNGAFVAGILWLVFVATFGSWGLYFLALRRFSAARVTAILYLSPPITMLWAWAMFDEPLSWGMGLGLAISLVGIVIFAKAPKPLPANAAGQVSPGS